MEFPRIGENQQTRHSGHREQAREITPGYQRHSFSSPWKVIGYAWIVKGEFNPSAPRQETGMTETKQTSAKGRFVARLGGWRWWVVVGVVVAVVWWYMLPARMSPHTGDGEFADLSVPIRLCCVVEPPVFIVRGYSVTFSDFDMGADYGAEYRVTNLPDISRDCKLYLGIDDHKGEWFTRTEKIRRLHADLGLEVVDGNGDVLCQANGPLINWVWGFWHGQCRLHQMSALSFSPTHDQTYTFRLKYTGDKALTGLRGYCYLECGARKASGKS
jgi:hypothetical protein